MANVTLRPNYQIINGIRFPSSLSPDCIRQAISYKPKSDDVFIATYPKCGTTWMQNIVLYILRKGKELEDHGEFLRMCPFIDAMGSEGMNRMPRPGAFKTHLSYDHMPYSPLAKYIIVLRNPKDCCVSLYHHTKTNAVYQYGKAEFDDFFELFLAGEVEYNDYFDHLLSWYPHRDDSQIFFTTYEDMKKDTRDVVLKVASFLGKEYIEVIQKDNNILNNILQFSSFEYMKKNLSQLYDTTLVSKEELEDPNMPEGIRHLVKYGQSLNPSIRGQFKLVRKGVVGDWKNHISEEQSERLSKKFLEKTSGTEIQEMYRSYL